MVMIFGAALNISAALVNSSGSAPIEQGDMRSAYKNSLRNALLASVKTYYRNQAGQTEGGIPDVSDEYIKFIKSYKILSRTVSDFTVHTSIEADLDALGLQDASLLIDNPVDTAVFVFSGLPAALISESELGRIINGALTSKQFSTLEQNNFLYGITNMADVYQVKNAFSAIDSRYLFQFKFEPALKNLKDPDNGCELSVTTDIGSKDGFEKILKIETGSFKNNEKLCLTEAAKKALEGTLSYVRQNVIQAPEKDSPKNSFRIKAVNFHNMVTTNQFISTLKQRGLISNYKAVSFSSNEIIFDVESVFTESGLEAKLKSIKFDVAFGYSADKDGIILDFSPSFEALSGGNISETVIKPE